MKIYEDIDYVYLAVDGDNIGNQSAAPLMKDDEKGSSNVSIIIKRGQLCIESWCVSHNCVMIVNGGDNATFKIPKESYGNKFIKLIWFTEQLRVDYAKETGFTLSVGIGKSPSQSAKALMVAKETGKDRIVAFNSQVNVIYDEIMKHGGVPDNFEGITIDNFILPIDGLEESSWGFRAPREVTSEVYRIMKNCYRKHIYPTTTAQRFIDKILHRKQMNHGDTQRLRKLLKNYRATNPEYFEMLGGYHMLKSVNRFLKEA